MPLDPSIITNAMTNITAGMPDASNLMAQRVQGAENIYKIETARQAAAKEEAAALKKEQEDALVKAMLPAFAHGFNNPTDFDGMLALVPPKQRPNVAPLVDQMRGMTPEQVVSALTGSLVTSDVGRSFLENQARQRTYQVQLQQAETAAAREAREAAAAGKPKPMSAYEAARIKLDQEKAEREATKVTPEAAKRQQAVRELDTAIAKISEVAEPGGLIDMSTNSVIGNILDEIVAQASGGLITLPGDVAAGQMEVIAHLARMAVPRFEGPQSEKDAATYERASGQLADPNTSNTIKRAAAQTVVEMLKARRDQFVFSGADADMGGGGDDNEDNGVLQYDEDGNLIE